MPHAANIYRLGVKELWSLVRDPIMLVLIAYTFTVSIYVAATAILQREMRSLIAAKSGTSPVAPSLGGSRISPGATSR